MTDVARARDLIGNSVYDRDGTKIGRVGNVYVDDATLQPEWVTVRTRPFSMKESFVPLSGGWQRHQQITVKVSREEARQAPQIDAEHGHLADDAGQALYSYYGMRRGRDLPLQRYEYGSDTAPGPEQQRDDPVAESTTGRHHRPDSHPRSEFVPGNGQPRGGRHRK